MVKIDHKVYCVICDLMKKTNDLGENPFDLAKEVIMLSKADKGDYWHYLEQYNEAMENFITSRTDFMKN